MSEQSAESPRRPAAERDNAFHLMGWLAEGTIGVLEELRHNDMGLPQEFWRHVYTARRESLLAARSFLDHVRACTDKHGRAVSERQATTEQQGNITIDFGKS